MRFSLSILLLLYGLSYSYYLVGGTAGVGVIPALGQFRHLLPVAFGFIGFFKLLSMKLRVNTILLYAMLVTTPLLVIDLIFYIQISILFLGTYYLSTKKINFGNFFFIVISSVAIVFFIDLFFNDAGFVYNDYYGRPRLLLGFFHPKEVGAMVLTSYVFYLLKTPKYELNKFIIAFIILMLFLIQSRNALLVALVISLGFFINKKSIYLIFAFIFLLPITFLPLGIDYANSITSNRLYYWYDSLHYLNMFGPSEIATKTNIAQSGKFHIDNFYLEYIHTVGYIPAVFFMAFILYVYHNTPYQFNNSLNKRLLYIGMLLYGFFDAAFLTTGNIFIYISWVIILSSRDNPKC